MPAITAAERLSSFGSRKVKRLFLSTSEGTFALPASFRKISRAPPQRPQGGPRPAPPGPKGLPVADPRRPVLDPALARDRRATRPAAVAAPAPPAGLRQV